MTWAQGVFAFCGGVLAPLTGILCAWRMRQHNGSPLLGFIVGFLTVFCALIGVSLLAIFIFPDYPQQPVSEPLATSFTLPVLIASILALWKIAPKASGRRQFPKAAAIVLIAAYAVGVFVAYHLFTVTWVYRTALPPTATDVKEYGWSERFLPDFTYHLTARITKAEFKEYVDTFDLKSIGTKKSLITNDDPPWWKPSAGTYEVYRLKEGHRTMEAFYDNEGKVWVSASQY